MREHLKQFFGLRRVFQGQFQRFGTKSGHDCKGEFVEDPQAARGKRLAEISS